jgi:hypothetical protein
MQQDETSIREYLFNSGEELLQAARAAETLDQDYVAVRQTTWQEPYESAGNRIEGRWQVRWILRITSMAPQQHR